MKTTVLLESLFTHRYAMPAFVFAYRYGGELYRAVVHGQTFNCVIGRSPISWLKVFGVIGAVILAILVVLLAFGAFFYLPN